MSSPYIHTGFEALKTDNRLGYSRSLLPIFKPTSVRLLKSLSSITNGEGKGIKKNEVCQLMINPAGEIDLGFFSPTGSGTVFYSFNLANKLNENTDFIFI